MGRSNLQLELDKKKLLFSITKAKTAKEEIEMKILEKQLEIERLQDHSLLQDEVITKAEEKISKVKSG